jgi:hypothetical protein
LTFADNPRSHFPRQHLPCTTELVKGLVHMLQRLDQFLGGRFTQVHFA